MPKDEDYPPRLPPRPEDWGVARISRAVEALERSVKTVADTVATMFESWPMLLKTQGDICSQLRDHERRIHRVEQHAQVWYEHKEQTVEHAWEELEASPTGTHARVTRSDVERLLIHRDLKRKAAIVDYAGKHAGKIVAHALTVLLGGALVAAWHWFTHR